MSGFLKQLARNLIPRNARNWLRSPGRTFEWVLDWARWYSGARIVLEPVPGWSIHCHPAVARSLLEHQMSDPVQVSEMRQFLSKCRPGMVLLDCGAHYGFFSLAAAHFGGPQGASVAIEPSPMAARMIRIQAKLNGLDSRIQVIGKCVAGQSGGVNMIEAGVNSDGYFIGKAAENDRTQWTSVPSVTIDEVCSGLKAHPTHIKIDVEGMEESVIAGGMRLLASPIAPIVFLELHSNMIRFAGEDPRKPLRMLSELGYSFSDVNGSPISQEEAVSHPLVRLMAEKPLL